MENGTQNKKFILDENRYFDRIVRARFQRDIGKVCKSVGMIFEGYFPNATIGSVVKVMSDIHDTIEAEVIGFRDQRAILMAIGDTRGINTTSTIESSQREPMISVGASLLGRVIDARGEPLDNKGPLFRNNKGVSQIGIYRQVNNPLQRETIEHPLDLGVRAINGLLTCAQGQRIGIMAGSGVGKSTLMGMMARNTNADINVIALIGERGREVKEFIERDLGEEGLKRSVVVVVTGDQSPLLRMRGAFVATAVAEYFCDQGANVLMMMDSVTRFCMAQREIGLSVGEPPASKGYTPSVFAMLPRLLERAGNWQGKGSITGIYTVLVDGDDMDEPIADASRAILDGHIVLNRHLAHRNHYPAIDISQSVSRCMSAVIDKKHRSLAANFRDLLALYQANEDLINIGAYVKGQNSKLDQAIAVHDRMNQFLRQSVADPTSLEKSVDMMESIIASTGLSYEE